MANAIAILGGYINKRWCGGGGGGGGGAQRLKACPGSWDQGSGKHPGSGLGFRVWGFEVWGLGFRVWGLGFRVQGLGFRV